MNYYFFECLHVLSFISFKQVKFKNCCLNENNYLYE